MYALLAQRFSWHRLPFFLRASHQVLRSWLRCADKIDQRMQRALPGGLRSTILRWQACDLSRRCLSTSCCYRRDSDKKRVFTCASVSIFARRVYL